MRIVFATSEAFPYTEPGTVADVCGLLPPALTRLNQEVFLLLPWYRSIREKEFKPETVIPALEVPLGDRRETARILRLHDPAGTPVYFVDHERFFDRDPRPSGPEELHPEDLERFGFFSRAVWEIIRHIGIRPDIIHCHGWQTALVPVHLARNPEVRERFAGTTSVLTIHNAAEQGVFPRNQFPLLGLPDEEPGSGLLEHHGSLNLLKGGILSADRITTTSRSYAGEIQTPGGGAGLESVLAGRPERIRGILNGVDYREWNPATDLFLAANYEPGRVSGKRFCKEDLLKTFRIPLKTHRTVPVIGIISSLAEGGGDELLADALPELSARKILLIMLGSGDARREQECSRLAREYSHVFRFRSGPDNILTHKILAGSDFLLIPPRSLPGGTAPMLALKYGAIPIARATGVLADTLEEYRPETGSGNGFLAAQHTGADLTAAVDRALAEFAHRKSRRNLVQNAMGADFSWAGPAREYLSLYRSASPSAAGQEE